MTVDELITYLRSLPPELRAMPVVTLDPEKGYLEMDYRLDPHMSITLGYYQHEQFMVVGGSCYPTFTGWTGPKPTPAMLHDVKQCINL